MNEQEKSVVVYEILKHIMKKETGLKDISCLKRKAGNIAKEIDLNTEDVFFVLMGLLNEIFVEEVAKLKKEK